MSKQADEYAASWVRGIEIEKLIAAGPDKVRDVLEAAVRDGWNSNDEARARA